MTAIASRFSDFNYLSVCEDCQSSGSWCFQVNTWQNTSIKTYRLTHTGPHRYIQSLQCKLPLLLYAEYLLFQMHDFVMFSGRQQLFHEKNSSYSQDVKIYSPSPVSQMLLSGWLQKTCQFLSKLWCSVCDSFSNTLTVCPRTALTVALSLMFSLTFDLCPVLNSMTSLGSFLMLSYSSSLRLSHFLFLWENRKKIYIYMMI